MAKDYYPEYYKKKRQRDFLFRKAGNFVFYSIIVLAGVLTAVYGFMWVRKHFQTEPGITPTLAEQRQDLETNESIEDVAENGNSGQTSPGLALGNNNSADYANRPYAESYPHISSSVATERANQDAAGEPASQEESEGEQSQEMDSSRAGEADSSEAGQTREEAAASQNENLEESSADNASVNEREGLGSSNTQETGDTSSESNEQQESPAADEQDTDEATEPTSEFTYRVYAGSYFSAEDAENAKNQLQVLGLKGNVIKSGGDYLVVVVESEKLDEAQVIEKRLHNGGFVSAFITRKTN